MMKTLDNKIFAVVSFLVKKWVKKQGGQKHKYDLFLMLISWETGYWFFAIIFNSMSIIRHGVEGGIFISVMLIVIVALQYMQYLRLTFQKERYDRLWEQRKNPVVYQAVKEAFEASFTEKWPIRKFQLAIQILFLVWMGFTNLWYMPLYLFLLMPLYDIYIFDFDDPDKKEKEHKESLTDVAKRAWESLSGEFSPKSL